MQFLFARFFARFFAAFQDLQRKKAIHSKDYNMVKQGYKQTEIGVIPEDWEVFDIQELINKNAIIGHLDGNHGALYPKSHEFVEDGIPYVGANALINGKIDFNKVKYLTKERANTFQKGISYPKDLLFAHNATVGPVAYVQSSIDKLILSTTLTYFRSDKSKLKSKYLLYEFQTERFVKQYSSVMSQSTRNQVPITAQRKFNIVLPPLAEQEAIAEALSDADAWIESLEQLIAKKRLIKQGAMQELLTPPSPSSGNADGEALEPWEVKKLGEVLKLRGGYAFKSADFGDFGTAIIRISDINGLTVDLNNSVCVKINNIPKEFMAENGDILIAMSGATTGKIGKYCYQNEAYINQRVGKFDIYDLSKYSKEYLYHLLYTKSFKDQLNKFLAQGAQPNVSGLQIENIHLCFPKSLSEQTRIATILSDMDAELEALETQLGKARQIKQGMMQELLTGRIRL